MVSFIWTICYLSVLVGLSAYGVHRYFIIYLFLKNRKRAPVPAGQFEKLPVVTVQLPIFNEVYVVERLLRAVSKLDYPRDRLQIQVLDDSTDDTREITADCAAELRERGFDVELIHRVDRTGFKAGALERGLATARGEFVCILDADFVPPPHLLRKTVDFFTDPKVGMIQTRWGHLNRGYSLLTRMQAMFLDGHLLLEQTARSRSGRFFNFNGTAGLWRRSCIEEAGGWQHDTLCEDLDLSYRAQLAGWKFIFLPDVVTPAELPVDMNGFKSQQHRWTKGSIQTCKKLLPEIWRSKLPMPIKLEATGHLVSNFAYLLLACLVVLLHPSTGGPQSGWVRTLLIDVPIFLSDSRLCFNSGFFTSHFAPSYNGYRNSIGTTAGRLTRFRPKRTYVSPSLVLARCGGCAGGGAITRTAGPAQRDRQCPRSKIDAPRQWRQCRGLS